MVGIDITHVDRIRALMARYPEAEGRFFTESERHHCHRYANPEIHFAGTFAAKEAVVKALGLGPVGAWARRIEILRDRTGAPSASVRDDAFPDKLMLSISHDGDVAVAVALSGGVHIQAPGDLESPSL